MKSYKVRLAGCWRNSSVVIGDPFDTFNLTHVVETTLALDLPKPTLKSYSVYIIASPTSSSISTLLAPSSLFTPVNQTLHLVANSSNTLPTICHTSYTLLAHLTFLKSSNVCRVRIFIERWSKSRLIADAFLPALLTAVQSNSRNTRSVLNCIIQRASVLLKDTLVPTALVRMTKETRSNPLQWQS